MRDALTEPLRLEDAFPGEDWTHWKSLGDDYQLKKKMCSDRAVMPGVLGELIDELCSPDFLIWLEEITGIKGLIPDPYLTGGGLHLSTVGGMLTPHTDFHLYERLGLFRQVNVLVYLSSDYAPGFGGELGLWERGGKVEPVEIVEPEIGTLVAFKTDDKSVHGFVQPCRFNRKSVALYYYTAQDAREFSGDYTTHWFDDRENSRAGRPVIWRARTMLYRLALQISRAFSLAAHLLNPRQGLGWWRWRQDNSS